MMSRRDIARDIARGPICTGGHLAVRGAVESKVRLAPFCLAERQVLAVCALVPSRPSSRDESAPELSRAFVAIAPLSALSLTHRHARAEFRAIPVHPGLGSTDISVRPRRERRIVNAG